MNSEILEWLSAQLVFIMLRLSIRFYPQNDITESVNSEILEWLSAQIVFIIPRFSIRLYP